MDQSSTLLTAQLLFLEAEDSRTPIKLYVNSPGGSVSAGLAIYDTMQYISAPVHTFAMGMAASMGSLLLAGGEKGHRYALKNSSVMIHRESSHLNSSWSITIHQLILDRTPRRRARSSFGCRSTRQGDPADTRAAHGYLRIALCATGRKHGDGQGEIRQGPRKGLLYDGGEGDGIWDRGQDRGEADCSGGG